MTETKQPFFCSALSRSSSEPIFGTARFVRHWLLLEYPGRWGVDAIGESSLPAEVKQHIHLLSTAKRRTRVLLIRQRSRRGQPIACISVHASEKHSSFRRHELNSYADLLGLVTAEGVLASPGESLHLICTHGTHDKCCSKYGLPVYGVFRAQAGEEAWECSHVGGDRFAANAICFPQGIYYGHLSGEDAAAVVACHRRGEVRIKNYRGRSCYPKEVQAGEYFIRSESGILGIDDLAFHSSERLDENRWRVTFEAPNGLHTAEYRTMPSQRQEYLTCKAVKPGSISRHELMRYAHAPAG